MWYPFKLYQFCLILDSFCVSQTEMRGTLVARPRWRPGWSQSLTQALRPKCQLLRLKCYWALRTTLSYSFLDPDFFQIRFKFFLMEVSRVFHCFMEVSCKIQECLKGFGWFDKISRAFQASFKRPSRKCQDCFMEVSMHFKEVSFWGVSRMFFFYF